jgi:hypothetical protein
MTDDIMPLPRADLADWAQAYIAARPEPDFTVLNDGLPQLQRWYVVPRNDVRNVYLHRFLRSDEARAQHDHRGDNTSWLLEGDYLEHLGDVKVLRHAGDVVERRAAAPHRIELLDDRPVISLFFIGPVVRDWGFHCPTGWRPWQEFVSVDGRTNDIGRGCG